MLLPYFLHVFHVSSCLLLCCPPNECFISTTKFYFNFICILKKFQTSRKVAKVTLRSKVAIYTSSRFINLHFVMAALPFFMYTRIAEAHLGMCVQTSTYTFFWTTWSKLQRSYLFTPESFRDTLLPSQLYTVFKIRKVNIYTIMIISNTIVCRPYSGFASCFSEVLEHIFLVHRLPKILHCI